jgi:hypothetical protein
VSNAIENLWSNIDLKAVSPIALIKTQSSYLEKMTKSLVRLDIAAEQRNDGSTKYIIYIVCDVIAERYSILSLTSNATYYPVHIVGQGMQHNQSEFMKTLKELFGSKFITSILDSIFAKINETNPDLTAN